jgi:ribosomal protein S18 acetylase RimI-like enzyme
MYPEDVFMSWIVRDFDASIDAAPTTLLDTSYVSHASYGIRRDGERLVLESQPSSELIRRSYAIDLSADAWKLARVAVLDGVVRGFVAWGRESWNRRLVIWHFYVDRPCRRTGAGRLLMDAALEWGRSEGLATAWVETANVNQPAVAAYRKLGFEICGFDTSLYQGTANQDDCRLHVARD